jgi:iron complex outermembrane recepter protein
MEKLMIKNMLNKFGFVRIALVASVGFPLIVASNTFAQDPPPAPAAPPPPPGAAAPPAPSAEVERVIVTGSNIPTAEEVGPNPVFNLNRDLINKSGQSTTTTSLLRSQPVASANAVPVENNGVSQGGPEGTSSVSLRGFDPGATLVLIDGRPIVQFPGAANSGAGFYDLNTVPITAVQSIEILKDGASTTYGANAVAGVVNLKLYKDYRGAQVTLYWGNTLDKDAEIYNGDVLFGVGDDKMSITGDIFFYHMNSLFNVDRGNSNRPPFLSSNSLPWNLQVNPTVAAAAGAPNPFPTAPDFFLTPPTDTNGLAPASSFIPGKSPKNRPRSSTGVLPGFNFNAFANIIPTQERWGGYAAFEDKICDDQLRIYGDFYYVDSKVKDTAAPNATNDFVTFGQTTLAIPPNHALPVVNGVTITPPNTPTQALTGVPNFAFNPFNPFEQIISGGTRARLFDFGNRVFSSENFGELFTVGVKGDKLFNGNWGYDGGFRYNEVISNAFAHDVNARRFNQIMNANDPIFNPGSSSFIGQTIPYNPFIGTTPFPSNKPLVDFATLDEKNIFTSKVAQLDLSIYTTDLFDLPAGGVGLALGGAFIRQSYNVNPDDQSRLGEEAGVTLVPPVAAGRKEMAFWAETLIPVFSPKWHIPGFYSLEFSAGVRYEQWFNNDTNAAVPKVGVRWQPFDEQLTIRSTWGEGFLEPSMIELYGPRVFGLGPTNFQGIPDPETLVVESPNRNLSPEHDRTWSGGLVYTPKWIPPKWGTLTLTVDFWDIERTGVVMAVAPQVVINESVAGTVPTFHVPPDTPTGTGIILSSAGDFEGVISPFRNGGRENANGVDLGLQYQIETGFGTWTLLSRWSYLNQFVFQFPGDRSWQVAGRANNDWFEGAFFGQVTGGDAWFKWKGVTNLDWTWHNWDLNATLHALDGFWEEIYAKRFDGFWKQHWVHPTWFTDVQLSYSLIFTPPVEAAPVPGYSKGGKEVVGKEKEAPPVPYAMPCWKTILNNSTITVGVNNVFGEDPPPSFGFELGNANGYPGFSYDNLGRFVYFRLIKKF